MQSITVQYSAVKCRAVKCSAVQVSENQCSALQYNTMKCNAMQSSAVQYSAVQCYMPSWPPTDIPILGGIVRPRGRGNCVEILEDAAKK